MSVIVSPSVVVGDDSAQTDYPRIYWQNLVPAGTLTSTTETDDEPIANLTNDSTALRWRAGSTAFQYVTLTLLLAAEADYLAIAAHNIGSTGAVIGIEVSSDGISWTAITDTKSVGDDSVIIFEFALQYARYYRLAIDVRTSAPSIGVLFIGRKLVLQRKLYVGHAPIPYQRETTVNTGRSESGQFLGRVLRREFLSTTVEQKNITAQWYRWNLEPFAAYATTGSFFFAWRPYTYPAETAFCWLMTDVKPSNAMGNGMMQFSLQMQGIR